jgi:hypothetical protein
LANGRGYIKEAAEILATTFQSRLPRDSIRVSEQLLSYQDALIDSCNLFLNRQSPFGADDLKEPAIKFAEFYASRARWSKAASLWQNILDAEQKHRTSSDVVILDFKCRLAAVHFRDGQFEIARGLLEPISASESSKLGQSEVPMLRAMTLQAAIYTKKGEVREACRLYEDTIRLSHKYDVHNKIDGIEVIGWI